MGIRLILKFGMTAVWNGFLLHCGGKSRTNDKRNHLCDLRWFNYVWTSPKNRYQRSNQSPREDGTNLNRDKVTLCGHFHVNSWGDECNVCHEESEQILDLSEMDIDDISPGSVLCGDLTSLGWSIIKSVVMCEQVETIVTGIANKGEWNKMEHQSLRR